MNKMIQSIQKKPLTAVLFAVIAGVLVFIVAYLTANPLVEKLQNYIELNFYIKNVVFKFFILIYSVVFILFINKGTLNEYGFNKPHETKYLRLILISAGIAFTSLIVGNLFFMGLMRHLFPVTNNTIFPEQKSLIQMILTIWIWSSLCEEVLVRGLIQSFVQHFKHIKFLKLSLPIWISGLFFGGMHFTLYLHGMGIWFVCSIMFFTTNIGLLAAYYRERSDSLFPAFLVHFVANVVGSIPIIISLLIS